MAIQETAMPLFNKQLELAINAKWNGITLKNYEQWEAMRFWPACWSATKIQGLPWFRPSRTGLNPRPVAKVCLTLRRTVLR